MDFSAPTFIFHKELKRTFLSSQMAGDEVDDLTLKAQAGAKQVVNNLNPPSQIGVEDSSLALMFAREL